MCDVKAGIIRQDVVKLPLVESYHDLMGNITTRLQKDGLIAQGVKQNPYRVQLSKKVEYVLDDLLIPSGDFECLINTQKNPWEVIKIMKVK
jgi:hypothetical protein